MASNDRRSLVKKLLYLFLFLVVLGIAGTVVLYLSIGRIVKAGVEKVGPRVTKCDVTVGNIDFSALKGQVTLHNLVVKNPEGFSNAEAFSLGEVRIKLVPRSLFSDRIVIEEVYVAAPAIRYEVALTGGTNVGRIQQNVEEFAAMFASDKQDEQPEEVKNAKKLQINDLRIEGGTVTVAASLKGVGTGVPVALPTIHQTNIGAQGDKTTYEVVADVLTDVLGSVVSVGRAAATAVLSGVKGLGDAALGVGGAAGGAVKGLGDGVKGLFRK